MDALIPVFPEPALEFLIQTYSINILILYFSSQSLFLLFN